MDRRLAFDGNAEGYDRWRPKYCSGLFSDIIRYSGIGSESLAVEIGCGTGQATEPILQTGCRVIAVEYGEHLAACAKKKFENYNNFRVENMEFEKFSCDRGSVDLVYAATAFHWISEGIGYPKVYNMLKSGGTLALFWNRPHPDQKRPALRAKMQVAYDCLHTNESSRPHVESDVDRREALSKTIKKYGFTELARHLYEQTRTFTAEDYLSLLNTYSDHIAIPPPVKRRFELEIREAIDSEGGVLDIYDVMDLYLAKKP